MSVNLASSSLESADERSRLASAEIHQRCVFNIIQTLDDLSCLEREWRDLENRSGEPFTFFQSFDWCSRWAAHFAGNEANGVKGPALRIFTVRLGVELIMIWPMMETRGPLGARNLAILGEPHSQYGNILFDPRRTDAAAIRFAWERICEVAFPDVISIDAVPAGSALADLMDCVGATRVAGNESVQMQLSEFSSWAGYQTSLGGKLRRGRAKRRNRLARLGEVEFEVFRAGDQAFDRVVRDAIHMKECWLRETGRTSTGMSWPGFADFCAGFSTGRLSPDGMPDGMIAHGLKLDGRTIAIEFGYIHRQHYYSYLGAFDWDFRDLSPGKIQIEASLRWCLENGITCYDLLPNPMFYKAGWTNRRVPVCSFSHALTLRGKLHERLFGARPRRRLKALYYGLPRSVRLSLARHVALSGLRK